MYARACSLTCNCERIFFMFVTLSDKTIVAAVDEMVLRNPKAATLLKGRKAENPQFRPVTTADIYEKFSFTIYDVENKLVETVTYRNGAQLNEVNADMILLAEYTGVEYSCELPRWGNRDSKTMVPYQICLLKVSSLRNLCQMYL